MGGGPFDKSVVMCSSTRVEHAPPRPRSFDSHPPGARSVAHRHSESVHAGKPMMRPPSIASTHVRQFPGKVGAMGDDVGNAGGPPDDQEGALLRAILDHTNDVIMVLEADGTIRFASASAEWLLGVDPEEQIGRSGFDFIHPDDLGDVTAALGRSVAAGPGPLPRKVVRVRHGDGTWRWFELSSYGMLDDPVVRGFVVTGREVTGRLDAEAGFRAMLAHSSDIISVLDAEANVRWSSAAQTRLLGYPSGETQPEFPLADVVHPDDLPELQKRFAEVFAGTSGDESPIVARVRAADGSWHSLEMMAINLIDDPNVQGIVINSRDVTDRLKMERGLRVLAEKLERSNAELERFALIASHDLQEPLRTISGFAQLLQRRHGNELDPEPREFLGYVVDEAMRLQDLINDLLAYSRVGRELRLETVDANALVEDVKSSLAQTIGEARAELVVHPLPSVQADRPQLGQVFQNLISNAIKFCDRDRARVEISAERSGDAWAFSVADNGIGVDASQAERIFEIFGRLQAPGRYEGTGTGLAICKRIVERHGGHIWVEPRSRGGSVFSFTLPIPETAPRP
jgi:PAS domain S-box-containing protein